MDMINNTDFHYNVAMVMMILSLITLFLSFRLEVSTYGKLDQRETKHGTSKGNGSSFGPYYSAQVCWVVFEAPNLIWVAVALIGICSKGSTFLRTSNGTNELPINDKTKNLPNIILLSAFTIHYVYRALIYPLIRMSSKSVFPVGLLPFTTAYTTVNG